MGLQRGRQRNQCQQREKVGTPHRAGLNGFTLSFQRLVSGHVQKCLGPGPWQNAKGVVVARSVEELHANNNISKETALDEMGRPVNGRTEQPNKHDMLTGSRPDGTAFPGGAAGGVQFPDMTCGSWTKSTTEGSAMLGHHDRSGPATASWATSWNSSHPSIGCSMERIRPTGGDALMYCFAEK